MSKQGRLVAAGLALAALAFVATRVVIERDAPAGSVAATELELRALDSQRTDPDASAPPSERSALASDPAANEDVELAPDPFATLLLRVVRGDADEPVPGAVVRVEPAFLSDRAFRAFHARTGADGLARIERVPAGWVSLQPIAGGQDRVQLAAGETLEHTLRLPRGYALVGLVSDRGGAPVADAQLWISHRGADDGEVVTRSAADGSFRIEHVVGSRVVAARSLQHAPSALANVSGAEGGEARVSLVLGAGCGRVEGRVVDPQGAPVARALVRVGSTDWMQLGERPELHAPFDSLTDADGRFAADCVWPGRIPYRVRADRFAQQQGEVEVFEGATARVFIELGAPVCLVGIVKDESGAPQHGAWVRVFPWGKFEHAVLSASDGGYRIEGLAVGELNVRAEGDAGQVEAVLHALPGEEVRWDPVLSKGLALRGRVLAEDDSPIAGWSVTVRTLRSVEPYHSASAWTDERGGFALSGLRAVDYELDVRAPGSNALALFLRPIRPQPAELVLRIPKARAPSVFVTGRLVDREGRPCKDARISVDLNLFPTTVHHADPGDGSFELGPYPPARLALSVSTGEGRVQRFGPRECAAGERWDLGTLAIGGAGSLVVRYRRALDAPGSPIDPRLDQAGREVRTSFVVEGDTARAGELEPGSYSLCVFGGGFACAMRPFEVRADEETAIEVELERGLERELRVELASPDPAEDIAALWITRASGELVLRHMLGRQQDGSWGSAFSLAPGSYRAEARLVDGRGASASFVVEAIELDPAAVVLRIE